LTVKINFEKNIMENEKKIIKRANNVIKKYNHKNTLIYNEYKTLFNKYKKLLEQIQYILKISDTYQINLIETKEKLKKEIKKLAEISSRDQLTGLFNRREFEKLIKREWRDAIRQSQPISIIMIDIDHFKKFNDNYGHLAGDNCLQKISQTMENSLRRPRDFLARYGGEEFTAILPNTNKNGAEHIADSLQKNVENMKIPHKFSPVSNYVTISLGVAYTEETELFVFEELLDIADQTLYKAKNNGRNKYCIAEL